MGTRLAAHVSYQDAPAALRWLAALGFEVIRRAGTDAGTVVHAELRCEDVVLMVASYDADYERPPLVGRSTGGGLAAGATTVFPPGDTEWGTRRAHLLHPEGVERSVGSCAPGEPGAGW